MQSRQNISESVQQLKNNLKRTKSVKDWAGLMGYNCPDRFARIFESYYSIRPYSCLKYYRLRCISNALRKNNQSNFEVARQHGLVDEIALNKYINYHLNCSPTEVKNMSDQQLREKFENLVVKIGIENALQIVNN
ncbi:MAG: hypothetical protein JJU13_05850 [Balneolaceae bacterium]|nr:hypothetical protein [Balneolaceae bacterium]